MIYVLSCVAAAYGILSITAAAAGMNSDGRKYTHITMLVGGALMIAAAVVCLFHEQTDFPLAVIGGAAICVAAFINGKCGKDFHLSHHIIRLVFTLILAFGFLML